MFFKELVALIAGILFLVLVSLCLDSNESKDSVKTTLDNLDAKSIIASPIEKRNPLAHESGFKS